jgi:hypothetical protein
MFSYLYILLPQFATSTGQSTNMHASLVAVNKKKNVFPVELARGLSCTALTLYLKTLEDSFDTFFNSHFARLLFRNERSFNLSRQTTCS